jgi:hypothetical protein
MAELPFHDLILTMIGISGLLQYYGSIEGLKAVANHWRVLIGLSGIPIYVFEAIGAFPLLSNASSLQLFGFFGCILGTLGSMKIFSAHPAQPVPSPA